MTVELTGLDGSNPLGFLAALGVISLPGESAMPPPTLEWTEGMIPHAVVSGFASIDEVVDRAMAERERLRGITAVTFAIDAEQIDDVKLSSEDLRCYIEACLDADDEGQSIALASALVAEGGYDNSGKAKPTDLHFTAGQQKFVRMERELIDGLDAVFLKDALVAPWTYGSELKSFMWDITDDRIYALAAYSPSSSSEKKLTEPGAEFLAILGLPAFPVFAGSGRTKTTACGGSWKAGELTWPLWRRSCDAHGARSLVMHAHLGNEEWLEGWGVRRLMRSMIRRSDQGGYGTLSPPTEIWRASS